MCRAHAAERSPGPRRSHATAGRGRAGTYGDPPCALLEAFAAEGQLPGLRATIGSSPFPSNHNQQQHPLPLIAPIRTPTLIQFSPPPSSNSLPVLDPSLTPSPIQFSPHPQSTFLPSNSPFLNLNNLHRTNALAVRARIVNRPKTAEIRAFWSSTTHVRYMPSSRENRHGPRRCIMLVTGSANGSDATQNQGQEAGASAAPGAHRGAPPARAQTAAARAAHSARTNPAIRAHDALVLPTILRLRGEGLSWARIAQELDGLFEPPGRRAPLPARRLARQRGVGGSRADIERRCATRRAPSMTGGVPRRNRTTRAPVRPFAVSGRHADGGNFGMVGHPLDAGGAGLQLRSGVDTIFEKWPLQASVTVLAYRCAYEGSRLPRASAYEAHGSCSRKAMEQIADCCGDSSNRSHR